MLRGKMDNSRVSHYLANTVTLENGCMIWQGNTSQGDHGRADYAVAEIHAEKFYVHRYIAFAPFDDETRRALWDDKAVQVLHSCDTKLCINPEHLTIGDQSDNMRDAFDKGILVGRKGEKHHLAKLTDSDVIAIRNSYAAGENSQRGLARAYGVSQGTIWHIVNGTHWSHI